MCCLDAWITKKNKDKKFKKKIILQRKLKITDFWKMLITFQIRIMCVVVTNVCNWIICFKNEILRLKIDFFYLFFSLQKKINKNIQ